MKALQCNRVAYLLAVASDLRPLLLLMLVSSGVFGKVAAAATRICRRFLDYDLDVEPVVEGPSAAAVVALLLGDGTRAHEVAVRDCQELPVEKDEPD